ncbi:MAG: DUF5615 family PIN-like protein [Pirellulales bacterium]
MSLSFFFDHHVDFRITQGLRLRLIEVLTAAEDGSSRLHDEGLMLRAAELERVVFSQDEDLLAIARKWQQTGQPFPGLVYAHQRRITIGQAVRDLELMGRALEPADMENRVEYLPFD